jgi:acyl-CoA synthetase (NDP forming)
MDAVFAPRSVAVYGASRDERKLGHTLLRNALGGGFAGRVVAVNPAGGRSWTRSAACSYAILTLWRSTATP